MGNKLTGVARRSPTNRSKVTNGRSLFAAGGDNRSPWARRMRDVFETHLIDLGGLEAASEAEKSILRRAAVMTTELERHEARFAVEPATLDDLDAYGRGASTVRRLLESVGLQRRARDVTPDLRTYLAAKPVAEPQDAF
jgi:hypothetical protein